MLNVRKVKKETTPPLRTSKTAQTQIVSMFEQWNQISWILHDLLEQGSTLDTFFQQGRHVCSFFFKILNTTDESFSKWKHWPILLGKDPEMTIVPLTPVVFTGTGFVPASTEEWCLQCSFRLILKNGLDDGVWWRIFPFGCLKI